MIPASLSVSRSPDQKPWLAGSGIVVEVSQSLWGTSTALVAFLTQVKQSHAELRHCQAAQGVLRMAT